MRLEKLQGGLLGRAKNVGLDCRCAGKPLEGFEQGTVPTFVFSKRPLEDILENVTL